MSLFNKVKSVFRKDEPVAGAGLSRPKIWAVSPETQLQLQKGTRFNMKVVIRGMRRTGKTTVLAQLNGHGCGDSIREYVPSPEISAATIHYHGQNCSEGEGTKVEVWDVVDEGILSSSSSGAVADASTVDVYQGCHCAVFMIDRTRRETLEYAVAAAKRVPPTIAVLLVLNFQDAAKPHAVTELDVDAASKQLRRVTSPLVNMACGVGGAAPPLELSAAATWISICAVSGHGVELLRSYLEIPNTMVNILALEGQMRALYRHIEQHQAWLLSERARLKFEEKQVQFSQKRDMAQNHPAEPRHRDVNASAAVPTEPAAFGLLADREASVVGATEGLVVASSTAAVRVDDARRKSQLEREAARASRGHDGDILASFFDDVSDDDQCSNDGESTHDSADSDTKPSRVPRGNCQFSGPDLAAAPSARITAGGMAPLRAATEPAPEHPRVAVHATTFSPPEVAPQGQPSKPSLETGSEPKLACASSSSVASTPRQNLPAESADISGLLAEEAQTLGEAAARLDERLNAAAAANLGDRTSIDDRFFNSASGDEDDADDAAVHSSDSDCTTGHRLHTSDGGFHTTASTPAPKPVPSSFVPCASSLGCARQSTLSAVGPQQVSGATQKIPAVGGGYDEEEERELLAASRYHRQRRFSSASAGDGLGGRKRPSRERPSVAKPHSSSGFRPSEPGGGNAAEPLEVNISALLMEMQQALGAPGSDSTDGKGVEGGRRKKKKTHDGAPHHHRRRTHHSRDRSGLSEEAE